ESLHVMANKYMIKCKCLGGISSRRQCLFILMILIKIRPYVMTNLELCEGDILHGQTATYTVLRFLGEGSFGMVVESIREAEEEVRLLSFFHNLIIGQLDSERCNVVQFKECFQYMGLTCLVFEMLNMSLWDLLKNHRPVLSISELRPIAQQLLVAFHALKDIDVIHADLKPDNVMLTYQPYRVKLIDFGMALTTSEQGVIMQPAAFRAPEVTLGCVYDFPIDMWGLGCTLVHLLVGTNLFPCCGYQSIKMMVDLLGMPPEDMLNNGRYTKFYFTKEEDGQPNPRWRLLTPDEYSRVNREDPGEPGPLQNDLTTLDDLLNVSALKHASHGAGHEVRPDSTDQPPSIQMPSQAEEVEEGGEIRSSEGELPQTELQTELMTKQRGQTRTVDMFLVL
uniref:Protein kinase domain-containing protein n=1 Tax=Neogobius melanostomus TaxID=47308 RepID=A0A8C6V839_9GOBI